MKQNENLKKSPQNRQLKTQEKIENVKWIFFFPWDSVDIKALEGCI